MEFGVQLQTLTDRPRLRPHPRTPSTRPLLRAPLRAGMQRGSGSRSKCDQCDRSVRYLASGFSPFLRMCRAQTAEPEARAAGGQGARWPRPAGRRAERGPFHSGVRVSCSEVGCDPQLFAAQARRGRLRVCRCSTAFLSGAYAPLTSLSPPGAPHPRPPAAPTLRGPSSCVAHGLRHECSPRCCRARARRRTSMQAAAERSHPPRGRTAATRC